MKQKLTRGILVAIEGIDGSGKSTLLEHLAYACTNEFTPVLVTKEPGSTPLGQRIRTIVQEKNVPICAQAEFLLFASDRAQHFQQVVLPAITNNSLVLCDRMTDSSLVYQGYGRGIDMTMINTVNQWTTQGHFPDLVLYVSVSAACALDRIARRNQGLTSFERELHTQTLLDGYQKVFADRDNVIIINGEQEPDTVYKDAWRALNSWLRTRKYIA